jgi:hypothetical protein
VSAPVFRFRSARSQNRAELLAARRLPDGRSWLDLAGLLCLAEGVTLEQLLSDFRTPAAKRVLGRAWQAIRRLTKATDTEIAEAFGVRGGWEGAARERAAGES